METILVSDDHAIAVASPLLVQVRRGVMTVESLAQIERRVREVRARFTAGRRVGMVSLLEPNAAVASNEVRVRQRALIEAMMEGLDARVVVAVMGDGVSSMLQRSVVRGLLFANPRVRVAKSPEDGGAWLAPHLGVTGAQIVSAIQRVRAMR